MKLFAKVVFFSMLCCSFLTGCKDKQSDQKSEKIELEFYYYKPENQDGLKNILAAYEKSHPGVSIKFSSTINNIVELQELADKGKLPDIIQLQSYDRVREFASRGLLEDLSNQPLMSKVLPNAYTGVTWNGKQWAVPMDYAGIGIIYNKDIFNKYGIQVPETHAQLEAACRTLKANGIEPFAGLLKENWSMGHFITLVHTALLKSQKIDPEDFVTRMNAGKGTYGQANTSRLFAELDFYRNNLSAKAAQMDGGDQQKDFANGKAAMMVQGLWAFVDAKKLNSSINAGFIPYPVHNKAADNVFFADVDSTLGVSSQSSEVKIQAAMEFLNWLASNEGQKLWMEQYKLIPPFKGVNVQVFGGPYVDLMYSVERKGASQWIFSQYPVDVFDGACKDSAQKYVLNKMTAQQVIQSIDKQWIDFITK